MVKKAAEEGKSFETTISIHPQVDAQFELAKIYQTGEGVPQDTEESLRWLLRAAEQGSPHAQVKLGRRYQNGDGVPQDENKAVFWYRKAKHHSNIALVELDRRGLIGEHEKLLQMRLRGIKKT
jgi:TPR repeat protein